MGIMQYKLIKFSHSEFDQNMWKSLWDKWKILFVALWKKGFIAWLKVGITQERLAKVAFIISEVMFHGAEVLIRSRADKRMGRRLHNAVFSYLLKDA
jgi:hypothetical protein